MDLYKLIATNTTTWLIITGICCGNVIADNILLGGILTISVFVSLLGAKWEDDYDR